MTEHDMNNATQENAANEEKLQQLLGAMFGGMKPMDGAKLTNELLSNVISGVMATMCDVGVSTERLIDALLNSTAMHVGAALVSLEAAERFQPGKTVEGCIGDISKKFGENIVKHYNEAREEAVQAGYFDQKEEDGSGNEDGNEDAEQN